MEGERQEQDMDVEKTESSSDRVRKIFNDWKKEHSEINVSLDTIREQPENSLFFTLIVPTVDPIFFQIYCNESWEAIFVTSENALMEEQLPTISAQIESRETPPSLHETLEIFAQAFKETLDRFVNKPQQPNRPQISAPFNASIVSNPQNQNLNQNIPIDLTNVNTNPLNGPITAPFPNMWAPGMPGGILGGMMGMHNLPHRFGNNQHFPHIVRDPPVVATNEDWRNQIIPAVQMALTQQNFQPYEIDEWVRRIQAFLSKGQSKKALQLIQMEILHGLIPNHIQKFFDQRPGHLRQSADNRDEYSGEGTEEANMMLQTELLVLKETNTKEMGFEAGPIGNDLFYWRVKLTGFGHETKVGQQLYEIALNQMNQHANINYASNSLVEGEVILEIRFPPTYPLKRPSFRIVKPRFKSLEPDLIPILLDKNKSPNLTEKKQKLEDSSANQIMRDADEPWNAQHSLIEVIQQIRTYIIDSGAEVDDDPALLNYPLETVGGFWKYFDAVVPKSAGRSDLEGGGKIILPPSALAELTSHDLDHSDDNLRASGGWSNSVSLRSSNPSTPMIFEISADHGKTSHCGVEEFTAEEGSIIVPEWVLRNLKAGESDQINIRRVRLPKGTFVKLQPHTADFLEVNDTRAMFEWVLPKFMVLNAGDTIVVPYRDKRYTFNVLEVKPGNSVHIIDSDVNVEFAPPLSGDVPPLSGGTLNTSTTTTTSNSDKNEKKEGEQQPLAPGQSIGMIDVTGQQEGVDYKTCDNCKRPIPMANYSMHSLTCARNNYLCPGCNVVVQKSQKEQHTEEFHALTVCDCGTPIEKRLLSQHKENECPKRIVTCSYCPLQMPYVERFEHEMKCGSQTVKCETCNKYVKKKDLPVHMVECAFSSGGGGESPNRFNPPIGPQTGGMNEPRSQDMMMCPICMSPFEHLDDLQVHMISEHEGSMDTPASGDNS
eukprot:TRINITY_DN2276_c1_g1_i1.p1 TRINITY_DN2276_c1_g1~~TRINITY_DN2276_c1_g1_i1.p1  ORF type:complete len:987 (-),score=366.44 TRINITY_DN2276_c1_g1_i1:33-2858(-)